MRTHVYLRKRQKGENVTKQKKYPGTPIYHNVSARNGLRAKHSVTRQIRIPAEIERKNLKRALAIGAMLGFIASAAVFGAVLWGWVIPTMDAAVATAQGAVL